MKPYPEYKPTGLAWLPEIPKHWDWIMLSQIATEQCNKNAERTERNVLSLSYGRIIQKKNLFAGLSPQDYGTYQIISPGNIVMRLTDLQNDHKSLRTGLAEMRGIITSAYTCLKTNHNPAFLHYLLHCYDIRKVFYGLGGGVRQSIGFKDIRGLRFPFPPADEQAQIVRYLDAMTAKINKLIRAKKRQIALLQEQKQAIINQAVTRGLDPDVELKDSGIDWLGPIPKQWQIVRMKNLFSFINRGTTPDYIEDRSYTKVVNQATFSKGYWDETQIRFTRVSPDIARGLLKQNDVLLASTGGGVLGKVYLFIQNGTYIADSHVTILRTQRKDVSPAYFFALLSTMYDFINAKLAKGSTNQTELQKDLLCSLVVPFPDIETQNVIVNFLDKKINIINLLIQEYQKTIEQYFEYKNSLIAAVVTGKVDVRHIAVEAVSPEDLAPSGDPDESEEQDSLTPEESEE